MIFCVTERVDEASEGVDITLMGDIMSRVSSRCLLLQFVTSLTGKK